ncbi:unnamed protein product [Discosporangium mesarthrocarpum]
MFSRFLNVNQGGHCIHCNMKPTHLLLLAASFLAHSAHGFVPVMFRGHQAVMSPAAALTETSAFAQLSRTQLNLPPGGRLRHPLAMCEGGNPDTHQAGEVLEALSAVIDPDLGQDIVTLGFVKDLRIDGGATAEGGAVVAFNVELTTPACPVKEVFQTQCKDLVEALTWVSRAEVTMTAQPAKPVSDTIPTGLSRVSNILAVSSCKGGVGKSTTAVNLAYSLYRQGAKVGILDADIYGPSLPTMVTPSNDVVEFLGNQIKPLEAHGVKLMSYGFVNQGAAVMRGPMVSQLLTQFVTLTSWGELDYLVIDMPPGTGDIQLTLCQVLNITASVIVTTPQKLSFTDVVKGIDLFDTVNVPSVAVVENMAYYETVGVQGLTAGLKEAVEGVMQLHGEELHAAAVVEGVSTSQGSTLEGNDQLKTKLISHAIGKVIEGAKMKEYIFGKGHQQRLADMWGITNTVQMPLYEDVAACSDSGTPYVVSNPEGKVAELYLQLAEATVREVAKLRYSTADRPVLSYLMEEHKIAIDTGGNREYVNPADLRRKCRCALCVEEITGKQLLQPEDVSEDIKPLEFAPIGNYAVSVQWSDGHSSLFPYSSFAKDYKPSTKRLEVPV